MPLPEIIQTPALLQAGLRHGSKGTHTTRTSMQTELNEVMEGVPAFASREDYQRAIVDENLLGKRSTSNRILSNQRLGELYGLDRGLLLFRVLRHLWSADSASRPMLAHLCALARDPLLRASAEYVVPLPLATECVRGEFLACLRSHVETRLNDASLDKVARNAGSSWSRSGHLDGRVRKIRTAAPASFGSVAYAIWLGHLEGRVADELFTSFWMSMFDAPRAELLDHAIRAKQMGLIRATIGAGIIQVDAGLLTESALSN
jgi:hypothetical protein